MSFLRRVPCGRGLYDRGNPRLYPGGFAGNTAKLYKCRWIAVQASQNARVAVAANARAQGLRTWSWVGPSMWRPATWRDGLAALRRSKDEMGVDGVIADIEEWATDGGWAQAPRAELVRMADQLELLARQMPVGFSTFPSWGGRDLIRERVPSLAWVQPQVYGVRNNLTAEEGPLGWADAWQRKWRQPVIPALAAWGRDPSEAAAYLRAFDWKYRGVAYWTGQTMWTDPVRVGALSRVRTRPTPANILGGLVVAGLVVGAAGAVFGGR